MTTVTNACEVIQEQLFKIFTTHSDAGLNIQGLICSENVPVGKHDLLTCNKTHTKWTSNNKWVLACL